MEKEGRWDDGRPGRFRLDKSKPLFVNKGLLACLLACLPDYFFRANSFFIRLDARGDVSGSENTE